MTPKWLCGVLFFIGCGSATPPLSPQEFCEGMQKSHCARMFQCATTPALLAALQRMYVDQDDCVQQGIGMQVPACNLWTEDNVCGIFGSSAWNGAAARTCVTDLGEQACVKALTGVIPGSCTPGDYCLG